MYLFLQAIDILIYMKKVKSEKESRADLLGWAKKNGCEAELLKIFKRYDDLLKGCKTEEEKKAVAAMGVLEIHAFFGGDGNLTVDGVELKK